MSNLWPTDRAASATRVGSFVLSPNAPAFMPWGSEEPAAAPEPVEPAIDIAEVEAQAFAAGFEEGRQSVETEFADDRAAVARLAQTLPSLRPEPTDALAALLAETVERLVRQIVGEVAIDPVLLAARAEAAAALVVDEAGPSKLRLHPSDLPLLDAARLPLPVVADPSLDRGALLVETASGWIEDGPEVRLERLRAELARLDPRAHGGTMTDAQAPSPVHLAFAQIAARLRTEGAPDDAVAVNA